MEPLLYNAGVCDEKAVLPIYPVADAGDPEAVALREAAKKARPLPLPEQYPDTIRPSRKGVPAVLLAALCLVLLLPFLIVLLPAGFLVNQLRFAKKAKE